MNENGNWNNVLGSIRNELANLAHFVDQTKKGIDTLENTVKVSSEKFPEASSQLNAVTGDLENAANNIMNILESVMAEEDRASELLQELAQWAGSLDPAVGTRGAELISGIDGINSKVKSSMMEIFTNMSFHDLSGQKLRKVINSLAMVEKKLLELAFSFGFNQNGNLVITEVKNDHGLLGAANPHPIDQSLVDKIMKEFGA